MKFLIFFELSCFVISSSLTEAAEVAVKRKVKDLFLAANSLSLSC